MPILFCFGLGYSLKPLARYAQKIGFSVSGTTSKKLDGIKCLRFEEEEPIREALAKATHLVSSIPPSEQGDPVLARYAEAIRHIPYLCYCSSLSVYGDHNGAWVYEDTEPRLPLSEQGARRLQAEGLWQQLGQQLGQQQAQAQQAQAQQAQAQQAQQQQAQAQRAKLSILRIAGIYGKGRNALERVRGSSATDSSERKPTIRSDKVFNRIHVDDLVAAMVRLLELQLDGIFNICDDQPAPAHEVMLYAAELLGCQAPEFVTYQQAEEGRLSSKMALNFHREHKRASNKRMKEQLGIKLLYPNYRKGLEGLAKLF